MMPLIERLRPLGPGSSTLKHGRSLLQVAAVVPLGAGLIGLLTSFGMMRQKDIQPSVAIEGMAFG